MKLFRFSSPASFYPLAGKLIPIFWVLTVLALAIGLYWGCLLYTSDAADE